MACRDDLHEYGLGLATVTRNFVFASAIKRRALISGIWSLLFCRCKRISWFYRLRLGKPPIGSHEPRRRSCHKYQQTQIESDKSARMRKHTDFKQIFFQISKSVMFVAAVIRFCSFTPRVCSLLYSQGLFLSSTFVRWSVNPRPAMQTNQTDYLFS